MVSAMEENNSRKRHIEAPSGNIEWDSWGKPR